MAAPQTVIELGPDTVVVITAPSGATTRLYKNAATQTSVDAPTHTPAPQLDSTALSQPLQPEETVPSGLPSRCSSLSAVDSLASGRGTASSSVHAVQPRSHLSNGAPLLPESDPRPPVHPPAFDPILLPPLATISGALPRPNSTYSDPASIPKLSGEGAPTPTAESSIQQDSAQLNHAMPRSKLNASPFARSSASQSSLETIPMPLSAAPPAKASKRSYSFAASRQTQSRSSPDQTAAPLKRVKVEVDGTVERRPAPFPMDVEASLRRKEDLRRSAPLLAATEAAIAAPKARLCNVGDIVFLSLDGRLYPYELCEPIANTEDWRLRPCNKIVTEGDLPAKVMDDAEVFFKQNRKLSSKLHQAASILWPSGEVFLEPQGDDRPVSLENDELYTRLLSYQGFVMKHITDTPPRSPFGDMVSDWFKLVRESPRSTDESRTFEFAAKVMTSRSNSDISLSALLSRTPRKVRARCAQGVRRTLLSPRHDAVIEEVNGHLTRQLREVFGALGPATQSGPARVILSFVLLAIQLELKIDDCVQLFHTGRIRRLPRYEALWSAYKTMFGTLENDGHLLALRVSDPTVVSSLYIAD
ncbi:hypothetical protein EXIGLDRAFT_784010 [Exidia glandulosa HHB12029]|uniref:Uncharacterized protein n=1 Tax=Exidia glandulosa HHB12029 TaxID=1314781 RepID=A0A166MRB4_EXIGL|nr:hypothetical protein EXIGLDRAFT_784010 [Exidia glandulosa HHB12029]